MSKNDFSDLGDQIKDMVQGAVKNMDFEKLNRDISGTVGKALDEVKSSMGMQSERSKEDSKQSSPYRYQRAADRYVRYENRRNLPKPVFGRAKGAVAGILGTVFGGIGTFAFGMAELSILSASAAGFIGSGITTISLAVLSPFLLASLVILVSGIRMNRRTRRFKRYLYQIGQASFITMEELSEATGKSLGFVRRDVRKMIENGMFPDGHIDPEERYLILNDETYRLYQATRMQQMEMKKQEEKEEEARAQAQEKRRKDDKLNKVMEIGEEYARQLKEANLVLEEKEISLKLTRLEMVIRKIFQCVELNPEKLTEIEKFTEYYLPTTLKLVNAYRDFDKETIQGENIKKAKEEISQTLNTIIHVETGRFDR